LLQYFDFICIDIGSIPDTLTTEQVDLSDAVGSGAFKTAYRRVVINGFGEVLGEVLINAN
jgi:hypothetical protein